MVVYGYRINGTNMDEVWNAIAVVQKKMSKIASKIYHEQLGKEIAFLCDNVTLSVLNQEEDISVYDSAVQIHRRIRGRTDSTDTDDADADPATFYLQYSGIDPGALPEGSPESSRSSCLLFQLSKGKYGCHRQRKSGTVSL